MTESTYGDELIERIRERRGHVWPLHHLMAEFDPAFLDIFDQAYVHTLGFDEEPPEGSLPVKYRELINACACTTEHCPVEVTAHHLRRAFEHGLTWREAVEGFHALLIPSGGVAVSNGIRALLQIREEDAAATSTSSTSASSTSASVARGLDGIQ